MTESAPTPKWLLLLFQLPTRPASARIKTWRRLQRLGGVAIKNSAYVLPHTPQAREDFEWLKSEILSAHGQAMILAGDALSAEDDARIRAAILEHRGKDYEAARAAIERVARGLKARPLGAARFAIERSLRAGRDEITRLDAMELIPVAARARAVDALDALAARLAIAPERATPMPATRPRPASFHGRIWVTRPRPGVDRMSSAWLIRRFIDRKAKFAFADHPPAGDRKGIAFDMFGVEFGHHGDRCTFEVLCDRFHITDDAVRYLARIVHDLDLKDDRYNVPEAAVVAQMVEGLRASYADDADLLAHGIAMFAALYESARQPSRRTPPTRRRRS